MFSQCSVASVQFHTLEDPEANSELSDEGMTVPRKEKVTCSHGLKAWKRQTRISSVISLHSQWPLWRWNLSTAWAEAETVFFFPLSQLGRKAGGDGAGSEIFLRKRFSLQKLWFVCTFMSILKIKWSHEAKASSECLSPEYAFLFQPPDLLYNLSNY